MGKPYRVIIWGPSNVGAACIREILRLPDFELAGVFAFSENKNGQDVGTLIGIDPIGIKAMTDRDAVLALDADCVIYCGRPPFDQEALESDVVRILESGKNVVSSTSHFYPPFHGQAYTDRIEAACKKGGTSIMGTGENPGFMMERLAATLCALTGTVRHIRVTEGAYVGGVPPQVLPQYGLCVPLEVALKGPVSDLFKRWGCIESGTLVSLALFGRKPDKSEYEPEYRLAESDITADLVEVKKGSTRYVRHVIKAYLDGEVRLTYEYVWYLLHSDAPFAEKGPGDKWKIEIEGIPTSMRVTLEAMASVDSNEDQREGDPTHTVYYVTAAPILQAIPLVCASEPGIVYPSVLTNALENFQRLAARRSTAG